MENLPFAEIVLHVVFLDGLNSDLLSSKLMHSEGHLTEGTFANQFHKFVEVQCCRRQLVILLNVLFNVLYQLVPFLEDSVIDFCGWLRRC